MNCDTVRSMEYIKEHCFIERRNCTFRSTVLCM